MKRQLTTTLTLTAIVFSTLLFATTACAAGHGDGDAKTVLITGANRGLGLEFARQYAADGWKVIGTARSPEKATELSALGVRVMQLDVADAGSVAALAAALDGAPVDLLINNAGIMDRDSSSIENVDFDSVERVLAVNTIGPMRVTKALLGNLRSGSGKQIVHITSGLGSIENNTSGGFLGYRESKAALNMFNRTLAVELGDEGFVCVVMSPGWVQTDMGGAGASLTPEQSITGMKTVIGGLTADDNGSYQSWDGDVLPW
jgi:NAD(P)-dependent dehydrogenase (short-subunit alcohol dehydrogenase family)